MGDGGGCGRSRIMEMNSWERDGGIVCGGTSSRAR